ncbi:MAG: hypothetical protein LBU62_10035 [Bacteroidales bacterium]|jgi:hypothetical protein|nr:hypothetical protein [Bacteroidales bacterium]
MKKVFIILLTAVAGFTACKGPAGRDGKTRAFTILGNAWELIGGPNEIGSYYSCLVEFPELDDVIYNEGIIVCYYEHLDELGDLVLSPMPYSTYDMYTNDRDEEVQVSINYSYTVSSGYIEFRLAYSDFYTSDFPPPSKCFFRVSVVY